MDTTKDKKSIQCYHPTITVEDEFGKLTRRPSHETITEITYEAGFTRLNKTTGEYTEFQR